MNRYVALFTAANVVLTIAVAALAELLKLKSGSGLAVAAALGASFFAAAAFARDHSRPPTSEERGAFAWRALLSTWVVSLVLAAMLLAFLVEPAELRALYRTLMSATALTIAAGAMLFVSAIYYVAIRWSFGWYAKLAAGQRA